MAKPEGLSYAQCLRVIGQYLDAHRINSFDLKTLNVSFAVSSNEPTIEAPKGLLSQVRRLFIPETPPVPNPVIFSRLEIYRLDKDRRAARKPGSPTDRRDNSFVLRVLGDYLDRKNATEFSVHCSRDSVRVRCDAGAELFTHQDLYDLGIRMYLRRGGR